MTATPRVIQPNATNANFPMPTAPLIDANGMMTAIWWRYLLALFNRTGGEGSPPSILDVAQNTVDTEKNFNSMVVPALAAALLQRVAALELMVQSNVQIKTKNIDVLPDVVQSTTKSPQTLPDIVPITNKAANVLPEPVSPVAKDITTDLYKFTSK